MGGRAVQSHNIVSHLVAGLPVGSVVSFEGDGNRHRLARLNTFWKGPCGHALSPLGRPLPQEGSSVRHYKPARIVLSASGHCGCRSVVFQGVGCSLYDGCSGGEIASEGERAACTRHVTGRKFRKKFPKCNLCSGKTCTIVEFATPILQLASPRGNLLLAFLPLPRRPSSEVKLPPDARTALQHLESGVVLLLLRLAAV